MKKNILYIGLAAMLMSLASCESGDNEFSNFDYSTVKFSHQYALRTVELGEDDNVDLTSDNKKMISIKASWGGGYTNPNNTLIDFVVDKSLCENLFFVVDGVAGHPVEVMPDNYYELKGNNINIPAGSIMGGVDVQLTDAFFNDPKAIGMNYVIPVRMTNVTGADYILEGMDYVLYAVKYVNPWHGQYLRRGIDTGDIAAIRHQQYVENDEVVNVSTSAYTTDKLPITVKDRDGNNVTFSVVMNFSDDNTCTLSSDAENVVIKGNGKFVSKGETNSLGGKSRNAIYLDYSVELKDKGMNFATKDTLVLRTRNVVGAEYFSVTKK